MVCFQAKNRNLGKFWRVLQWKMLVYFIDTWSILWSFVIFYRRLVKLLQFGIFYPVLVFCAKKNLATLEATRRVVNVYSAGVVTHGRRIGYWFRRTF
jgi:hypothetical protein